MIRMNVGVALAEVPVNIAPLVDDDDFITRKTAVAFNEAGMDLVWNFVTPAGAFTQTPVTPTSGGDYDWTHQGDGIYTIEIPASGGASINNNQMGYGWFSGVATDVAPWVGPMIEFGPAAGISGLFSGTHTSTTSDLGASAPANDITGQTLFNPTDGESRVITSYNTGTGVATHAAWATGAGVSDGEPWLLFPTAPIDSVTLAAITAAVPTVGQIADGVFDEATAGHTTAGTFGEQLKTDIDAILDDTGTAGVVVAAASKTGYTLSAAGIQAIWDALTSALSTANSIGKAIVDLAGRIVGTLAAGTHTAQSGDSFARIGATGSGLTSLAQASVVTEARLAELDQANLPADVAAVATAVGDVPTNAELATALAAADDATLAAIALVDTLIDDVITRLPAATVDGLTPTQIYAAMLASCAGRIVDKTANPMIIQNPGGTQTRITVTPDRASITLSFTGV